MKKILSVLLLITVIMTLCGTFSSAAASDENIVPSEAELSDNEILALYAKAVLKAREEKPAYHYRADAEVLKSKTTVRDPLNILAIAGISTDKLEKEFEAETLNSQNGAECFCEKNSIQSANNLPDECRLTDALLLKDISMYKADNGNSIILIDFADEKNPDENGPLCTALNCYTNELFQKELSEDFSDEKIEIKAKANGITYSNVSLVCEINPETSEFYFLHYSFDLSADFSIITLFTVDSCCSIRGTDTYCDFNYSDVDDTEWDETDYEIDYSDCEIFGEYYYSAYDAAYDSHTDGEWIVIRPATVMQTGIKNHYCSDCGAVIGTEIMPKLSGKVSSVSLDDVSLTYKTYAKLSPEIDADENTDYTVKYESSDSGIVSVDSSGKIYGVSRGEAKITCTVTDENGNSVSDTCTVKVAYTWWQWLIRIVLLGWIWY